LHKSKFCSFSLITFGFAIFWRQNIGKKLARKMLMKLTPGDPSYSHIFDYLRTQKPGITIKNCCFKAKIDTFSPKLPKSIDIRGLRFDPRE